MASATVDSPVGFDRPVSTAYTHNYQSPLLLREEGAKPAARPVSVFLGAFLARLSHSYSSTLPRPVPRSRFACLARPVALNLPDPVRPVLAEPALPRRIPAGVLAMPPLVVGPAHRPLA